MKLQKQNIALLVFLSTVALACNSAETVTISEDTTAEDIAEAAEDNDTNATVQDRTPTSTANEAPTISDVSDQAIAKNGSSSSITVVIADDDDTLTCASSLSATAANTTLIPSSGFSIGGTAPNCSLTITPATGQTGSTNVALAVTDGEDAAADTFTVTVSNSAPTISDVADQSIAKNGNSGAIAITVSDSDDTLDCSSDLSASSDDDAVVNGTTGVSFGGTAPNCTVTITPESGVSGSANLTLTLSDGSDSDTDAVAVTVTNSAPSIDDVADQSIDQNSNSGAIAFTISDSEDTLVCTDDVSVSSSNTTVLPNANVTIAGASTSCTVTFTPATNQTGSSTVTLTVSDGDASDNDTVAVTVSNVAPTVSDVSNTSVDEGSSTSAIAFTIDDEATTLDCDNVTATSGSTSVIPDDQLTVGGSGTESCTITVGTTGGSAGTATITLSISDGSLSGNDTFDVTVTGYCDSGSRSGTNYANDDESGIDGASSGNAYAICTAEQFQNIGERCRNGVSTDCGKYFILRQDIDLLDLDGNADDDLFDGGGELLYPIGDDSASYRFTGEFDGNGNTISNFQQDVSMSYSGMFGYTSSATIKNLEIATTDIDIGSSYDYVGNLIGYALNTTIQTVKVTSGSIVVSVWGADYLGGLVGYMNNGTALEVGAQGTVQDGATNVGGLVGYATGTDFDECYSTGWRRIWQAGSGGGRDNIGGLIGEARAGATINDCYATGNAVGAYSGSHQNDTTEKAGGLIGMAYGATVTNTYATGRGYGGSNQVAGLLGRLQNQSGNTAVLRYSFTINGAGNSGNFLIGSYNSGTRTSNYYYASGSCSGTCDGASGTSEADNTNFYDSSHAVYTAGSWDFTNIWVENASDYPHLKWTDDNFQ